MEIALFPRDICSVRNLSDQKHSDDVVQLGKDSSKLQVFFDRLNRGLGGWYAFYTFEVQSAISGPDWLGSELFACSGAT